MTRLKPILLERNLWNRLDLETSILWIGFFALNKLNDDSFNLFPDETLSVIHSGFTMYRFFSDWLNVKIWVKGIQRLLLCKRNVFGNVMRDLCSIHSRYKAPSMIAYHLTQHQIRCFCTSINICANAFKDWRFFPIAHSSPKWQTPLQSLFARRFFCFYEQNSPRASTLVIQDNSLFQQTKLFERILIQPSRPSPWNLIRSLVTEGISVQKHSLLLTHSHHLKYPTIFYYFLHTILACNNIKHIFPFQQHNPFNPHILWHRWANN